MTVHSHNNSQSCSKVEQYRYTQTRSSHGYHCICFKNLLMQGGICLVIFKFTGAGHVVADMKPMI